jgi:hypothetical protein
MRWDNLFYDLEAQLAVELTAEEHDLGIEEERLRLARLTIRDRLFSLHKSAVGPADRTIGLQMIDGTRFAVAPSSFGRDWFSGELVHEGGSRPPCIVSLDAIAALVLRRDQTQLSLNATATATDPAALAARLGLTVVLRDLCRRRHPVGLFVRGAQLFGTIDRVGRDNFDLAVHEPGEPRRQSAVTELRVVALSQLMLVRL